MLALRGGNIKECANTALSVECEVRRAPDTPSKSLADEQRTCSPYGAILENPIKMLIRWHNKTLKAARENLSVLFDAKFDGQQRPNRLGAIMDAAFWRA